MQYQPMVALAGNYFHSPSPQPASSPYTFDPNRGFQGDINYAANQAQLSSYYTPPDAYVGGAAYNPTTPIMGSQMNNGITPPTAVMQTYGAPASSLNAPTLGGAMSTGTSNYDWLNNTKDKVANGLSTAADNAQTAWGKMSYGERGTAMLGAATSLYGAYNARKTGKLAQEQFQFTKDSFNKNFEAQAKTTNSQLADRQNARNIRNPTAHASVSDYMKKYGV